MKLIRPLALLLCLCIFFTSLEAYDRSNKRWVPPTIGKAKQKSTQAARLLLKPELKALVVIDPGHGGKDLGAYSKKPPKYQEKHLALSTAFLLKEYLLQLGYAVLMTRTDDKFISLEDRSTFANKRDPDLFVSLHYNSAPNKQAEGIEIFYYQSNEDKSRSKQSQLLAQKILKRLINNTDAKSRGVKHGNLSVIRETTMPAVLVEGGFLTHEEEVVKIKNGIYLKKLAWGIAQGIQDFLEK